jgi:hypothetical protein
MMLQKKKDSAVRDLTTGLAEIYRRVFLTEEVFALFPDVLLLHLVRVTFSRGSVFFSATLKKSI